MLQEWVLSLMIGCGVGLASTYLGLGGGILIVPLLPLVAEVSARSVIGTSLLTVFLVALQNTWYFSRRELVEWRPAILIGVFASMGAFLAAWWTRFFSELGLNLIFVVLLLVLSFKALGHKRKPAVGASGLKAPATDSPSVGPSLANGATDSTMGTWPSVALGMGSGLISGFTGVGGGVIVVPVLSVYNWVRALSVVPTSVAVIMLSSGAGTLAFVIDGLWTDGPRETSLVRWDLAAALFVGARISSVLTRHHGTGFEARKRDWLVGLLLLLLAIRVLGKILSEIL